MLENVIDTTEYCRHCLMCRHVAPVGNITNRETVTPHGVGQLVASERRGMIDWDEDTVDALYAFSDNGNSRTHCVTSQPLGEAVAAARALVVDRDKGPDVVYRLKDQLRAWENPYEEKAPEPVEGEGDVALFVGDDTRYLRPSVLEAVVELLNAVDIDPVLVGVGRNSGFLPSSLGLPEVAKNIARANIEDVRAAGASQVLVVSPGHYFAFTRMYDERLGVEWPDDIDVHEVVSVLSEQGASDGLTVAPEGDTAPYTYLDPTHAVRVEGRHDVPRRLVEAVLPGERKELFWRKERAYPCGNLALAFTQPELAEGLTRERFRDAQKQGVERIITECPGSLYYLDKYADEYGIGVEGLYELIAERLK